MKDNGFSNKPLDKSFYPILPLSVYNYLNYTDFFIFIWFEEIRKGVMVVIIAISVMAGTPLVATIETTATLKKGVITVITAILITARTPLVATAEIIITPGTRLN